MTRVLASGLIVLSIVFAISQIVATAPTGRALAQDATPVATVGTQPIQPTAQVAQTTDRTNDNGFPWDLLGLLGLAGLAGLRRPAETVRREPGQVQPTVGVYDNPKR